MSAILDAVTHYTEAGIIVHPLKPAILGNKETGKAPIPTDWQHKTTPYAIGYLEQNVKKGCNIGANCGKASNLTVIDVDLHIKGIWDYIFDGVDTSKFVIQRRTEKQGKKHFLFKYNPLLETNTHTALGFDIRNDGGNIVLSPSTHYEGDTYKLFSPIENRSEVPEIVVTRINEVISTYKQLESILKNDRKCRPCFYRLWYAVFVDNKSDLYLNTTIFRQKDGRDRQLHLFAELKKAGATDEMLNLACMLIFGEFYNEVETANQLKHINADCTAKTETLHADEYYSKYNITSKFSSSEPQEPLYAEMTVEEIQARKEVLKDRRLPLVLPPEHFVSLYCDWLNGVTDGYEEYKKLGALWLISAFCNDSVAVKLKQETVRPNVFITIFGNSTTARKSTVVQRTRLIYEAVTGEYLPNEDFSIEGYLESLSMSPMQHHVRDEVAGFLAKIHKQYNEGFNELECAVYDGQNFRKTLASKGAKEPKVFDIRNPYVTKFYATTSENYLKFMTIEDFLCGREYRTLFCFPTYTKNKMQLGVETDENIKKWTMVLQRASEIYNFIKNHNRITFGFNADALDYYSKVTSAIEDAADKSDNGVLCSAVGRSQIHILKLAMLLELGKSPISTTITKESVMVAANAVTTYFIPTLMDIVDRLQEDAKNNLIEKVISVLRRCGGVAQHTKALHDAKMKSKDFAEVIATLCESETIEVVKEKKSKKVFYLLAEMKQTLDLTTFQNLKNPQNPQNLPNLSLSHDQTSKEILETLKNITLSVHACNEEENNENSDDSLAHATKQSKNIISLQNPSVCSDMRDEEISEIREIKEIQTVEQLEDVPEDQGASQLLNMLEQEGF